MPQLVSKTIVGYDGVQSANLKPVTREAGVTTYVAQSGNTIGSTLPGKAPILTLKKSKTGTGVVSGALKLKMTDKTVTNLADVPASGLRFGEIELSVRFHEELPTVVAQDMLTGLRTLLFDPDFILVLTTEEDMY